MTALRFAILGVAALAAATSFAADLERQRELFVALYPEAERGNWQPVEALPRRDRRRLESYALWPDLRAAWFRATIETAPHAEIEAFLDEYGALKPAREIRYRYALHLAERGAHADYLDVYDDWYASLGDPGLDCLALAARIALGDTDGVAERGRALWLVGKSQAAECDPVFEYLADEGLLSAADYRERYRLAIEARQFGLARWLARSIDAAHVSEAGSWLRAAKDPEGYVAGVPGADAGRLAEQLAWAVQRIAFDDPVRALALWRGIGARDAFDGALRYATERHIALWAARNRVAGAYALLAALPRQPGDDEVLRWRARVSLRAAAWRNLAADIELMPPALQDADEWRYWRAIAAIETGDGTGMLETLAAERSYYGFLAADRLDRPYALAQDPLPVEETVIAALSAKPAFVRARELFLAGLDGRGRSEWDDAVSALSPGEKAQAAVMAHRWGWHSRAIATAADIGHYDDLELRYPLAHLESFEEHASAARIEAAWALGVARSESLFMRDARSHAGAVGLMQLLPSTGRRVAREIALDYGGLATLIDPHANIRLGTRYLADMAGRYAGHRVLATAAYNAGPQRVDGWLPSDGSVDARVWIENIPYDETRSYVRRVLAADTIFHWRMTGETRRLSDSLTAIPALPSLLMARTRP